LDKYGGASIEFIENFAHTIFLSIVMPLAVASIFSGEDWSIIGKIEKSSSGLSSWAQ
jgi:hypothetical protein